MLAEGMTGRGPLVTRRVIGWRMRAIAKHLQTDLTMCAGVLVVVPQTVHAEALRQLCSSPYHLENLLLILLATSWSNVATKRLIVGAVILLLDSLALR